MKTVHLLVIFLIFSHCSAPIFAQVNLVDSAVEQNSENSIITIENALKTTAIQDEESDIIRFEGNVQVSVENGDSKTTIFADFVDFNRNQNLLYAEGSVSMEQSTNGKLSERLTADSLLFDTKTQEGFFNQGRVVQEQQESLNLGEDSVLIVSSELFSKGSSNTVTFKNGRLTFCNDENPHWEIRASRIWLLPGNEFAFANALLFVGPVPVMWLPFFYYPKEELVFNPSFGFKAREGFYINTTTYIIGRKPLSEESEDDVGFNFMQQTELKEQHLEGLVLRNLDEKAIMPTDYLKIMADYYTTLGGMVGVEGYFEPNEILKDIGFGVRLGFSNTVFDIVDFPLSVSYYKDKKYRDYGWFFGLKTPFRYTAQFNTSFRSNGFSLNVDIPFYSDPWFDSDFADRTESMDWIDFFLSGSLASPIHEDNDGDEDTVISGYTWNVNASYRPDLKNVSPWISTLSLSSLNSSVVFTTQNAPKENFENDENIYSKSPNRKFFYPSQIKPLSVKFGLEGNLVNWSTTEKATVRKTADVVLTNEQNEIISLMQKPEDLSVESKEKSILSLEDDEYSILLEKEPESVGETIVEKEELLDEKSLPQLKVVLKSIEQEALHSYSLKYSFNPEFSTLYTYSGTKPNSSVAITPQDFDITDPKLGQFYFKSPLKFSSNLNVANLLFSMNNTLSFLPEYRIHHTISSSYYDDTEKENLVVSDYKTHSLDLINTNTVSLKPLKDFEMFKNTSINWNTSVNFVETNFSGTYDNPSWDYKGPKWDDDSISSHNLNAVFEAKQGEYSQMLSLKANLPPQLDLYSGALNLGFPFGSISVATGYEKESATTSVWKFQDLKQSSRWTFFDKTKDGKDNKFKLSLQQSYTYDIEQETSEDLFASIGWYGLELSYRMRYGHSYTLDLDNGWVESTDESFLPYSLGMKYRLDDYEYENEKETVKIKPGLETAFTWDMIIPTRSYFWFEPSLSITIKDFLTLKFSAESRNNQLVRYMQDIIAFPFEIPGEKNVFVDLWDSFCFWNPQKRLSSGFKIESFNIAIEHDLHDWTLSSEFSIEPRIVVESDASRRYDYSPYFTLSVAWKPMSGVKTTIEDKYGEFSLNP